jgi:Ca-activated chloride channel family protein
VRRPSLAALVTISLLAVAAAAYSQQQSAPFRTGVDLVTVPVAVTDKRGALATGLTAEDFTLLEDGRPQTISYFAIGSADAPSRQELHLGLLLDVSQSMADDIAFTRTASIKFLNTLVDAVDITLVDFDTEIRVARFGQADFPRLVERIRHQQARGSTALYDALGVYLNGAADQRGRKIVLVYSDGGDTRSALSLKDTLDLLKASDVTVYAIGAPVSQSGGSAELRLVLHKIAEVTGGRALFPASIGVLDRTYAQIVEEIRGEYVLGYHSTNTKTDGTWRSLTVRVARQPGRDLRLRARKGYFAALAAQPGR